MPRDLSVKKLNKINTLKGEIKCLEEKLNKQEAFLKRLAAEYTILGKECENEKCMKLQ